MNIQCPHCNVQLEALPEHYGKVVECASCGNDITIQEPAPPTTKECPFCSEEIKPTAKKCKHCGEFLDKSIKPSTPPVDNRKIQKVNTGENVLNRNRGCGDILIFGPIIFIVIIVLVFLSRGCN